MAQQFRRASSDDKDKVRKELEETIDKHFEVRQSMRKHQLDRMEKELKRLREEIDKRNEDRKTIIKNHLGQLIGDSTSQF